MSHYFLENELAKTFIKDYVKLEDDVYVKEWNKEKNVKLYYLKDTEDNILSFCLLSNMKHDPLKIHEFPCYINYIYTFEKFKRKGYAYELLLEIKKHEHSTIFCTDDISKNLFTKAGFIFNTYDPLYNSLPIYRFP